MRICSSEEVFNKRMEELKYDFLIPRQYKPALIDRELKRVKNLPGDNFIMKRKEALRKVEKIPEDRNRVVPP